MGRASLHNFTTIKFMSEMFHEISGRNTFAEINVVVKMETFGFKGKNQIK